MAVEKLTVVEWLKKNRFKLALIGIVLLIAFPIFYYFVIYIPNQEIRKKGALDLALFPIMSVLVEDPRYKNPLQAKLYE